MSLPTNLKNDILDESVNTVRRYNIRSTANDQIVSADVYLEEITEYEQEGDVISAAQLNESNELVNGLTLDVKSIQVLTSGQLPTIGVEDRLYLTTF